MLSIPRMHINSWKCAGSQTVSIEMSASDIKTDFQGSKPAYSPARKSCNCVKSVCPWSWPGGGSFEVAWKPLVPHFTGVSSVTASV